MGVLHLKLEPAPCRIFSSLRFVSFHISIFYGLKLELLVRLLKCKALNNSATKSFSWDFLEFGFSPTIKPLDNDGNGVKTKTFK